jgi:DNA-binding NarL/FixJ family response regulator
VKIRCVIVDDHPIFREGLARMMSSLDDIEIVATGATVAEALALVEREKPDVVLLDVRLPDRCGLDALPEISQISPETRTIILTGFAEEDEYLDAYKLGARGVLLKEFELDHIAEEIRIVASGGVRLDTRIGARLVGELQRIAHESGPPLSRRETQILVLLTRGLSNCEIAMNLGIQETTVKSHLTRLFEKVGVTDRLQAALYAVRLGLDTEQPSAT